MDKTQVVDMTDPVIMIALDLAMELKHHCEANAFAIARDAREKGYLEGKAYEKGRITELLGLVI